MNPRDAEQKKSRCFFIGAPRGDGSVATYFAGIGSELAARGHDVKIISYPAAANGELEDQNPANLFWPSPRPTRFADAVFLARLIRRHRPDCLIANFAAVNWMCLIGWLCRVRHRIAFYHTLSDQIERDNRPDHEGRWEIRPFRKKLVYKTATAVAGMSQAALLDARNTYGVPARKCQLWRYSMPDPASRIRLQSPQEREDVVVCVGRLHPSKGQDVLISALALAQGPVSSSQLELIGKGLMLERLRQMAEQKGVANRCRFVGAVSHDEVLTRMSRAKITVVPSRNEAFGLVNIESMSVGTPVIASRVGGIPEILRDGIDGFLVPPEDPGALAGKLSRLLADPELQRELGQNARQRFLEHYEHSAVVGGEADRLEQLVWGGVLPAAAPDASSQTYAS